MADGVVFILGSICRVQYCIRWNLQRVLTLLSRSTALGTLVTLKVSGMALQYSTARATTRTTERWLLKRHHKLRYGEAIPEPATLVSESQVKSRAGYIENHSESHQARLSLVLLFFLVALYWLHQSFLLFLTGDKTARASEFCLVFVNRATLVPKHKQLIITCDITRFTNTQTRWLKLRWIADDGGRLRC